MVSSLYTSSRPDSQVESTGIGSNIPSQDASQLLERPRASYLEQTPEFASDASRGSIGLHSPGNSSPLLAQHEKRFEEAFASPEHPNPVGWSTFPRKRSIVTRPIFWIIVFVALIIVAAAVILPVYFFVIKSSSSGGTTSSSGTGGSGNSLTTGGNGSIVTTSDGTTFTYINNFGGFCESSHFLFSLHGWDIIISLNDSFLL